MTNVSRLGDLSTSDPCGAPPRGSAGASTNVFANSIRVHRKDDAWQPHACPASPPHGATTTGGSPDVYVNAKQVARVNDTISCGSTIAQGSPNVFANESFVSVGGVTLPSNQNSFKNAEPIITTIGYSAIDDEFEINDGVDIYPPMPQTSSPPPIPPAQVEHEDDQPAEEPPAPPVTDCSMITLPINYDFQLSPNFKLRQLSVGCIFPHSIKAQNGLTEAAIVCNLKALAENVLEPMRAQWGSFRINSGFRTRQNGRSQHEKGQACDIQFPGKTYDQMFAIAQWVKENINYDQLLWEHGNAPWIHVSFNSAGNRPKSASNAVMTMYRNQFSPGLKKIAAYS